MVGVFFLKKKKKYLAYIQRNYLWTHSWRFTTKTVMLSREPFWAAILANSFAASWGLLDSCNIVPIKSHASCGETTAHKLSQKKHISTNNKMEKKKHFTHHIQ